ncbi:Trans-enoyl reductase ACTTS2 [Colletotrichum spinosum]|uniref:Trans-enoyl reductase ACTTS2 n=1 Tax=Colletotrichum spinosum TaxID=1347390 RepID=A0A4V3HRB4_9PEZI|nr:Trans-enoyl reductase ACTTS2 [Colletotrichum spinosum]
MSMQAIVTQGDGVIALQEVQRPTPGPGEVLVKIHYAAQNPGDYKTVKGAPPIVPPASAGLIAGCDFAGTIEDANDSVWTAGQRVAGFIQGASDSGPPANPIRGAFAEYVTIEPSMLFEVPKNVELKGAATVGAAFATATQAMYRRLRLPRPGDAITGEWLLIYGGATSVGDYAIQLAKLSGLKVVTTASPRNHDRLKSLGADAVFDYRGDWVEAVKELTGGKLQKAFDTVCQDDSTLKIAETLSHSAEDHIVVLVPAFPQAKEEIARVNPHAKVEWTMVFTVFGKAIPLVGFDNVGGETPEDKRLWEEFLRLLPQFLEKGQVKTNRTKELGGLGSISEGFKLLEEGKVSNEKLVHKIM